MQLGSIALRTYYRQTTRDNIATLKTFDDKRAEIRGTLPQLSFGDNNLTPTVVLKWDRTTPVLRANKTRFCGSGETFRAPWEFQNLYRTKSQANRVYRFRQAYSGYRGLYYVQFNCTREISASIRLKMETIQILPAGLRSCFH